MTISPGLSAPVIGEVVGAQPVLADDDGISGDAPDLFDETREMERDLRIGRPIARSVEATAAHKATAHYARWREAVADMMAEPRTAVKYANVFPPDKEW